MIPQDDSELDDDEHGDALSFSFVVAAICADRVRCSLETIWRTTAADVAASPRAPTANRRIAIITSTSVRPLRGEVMR